MLQEAEDYFMRQTPYVNSREGRFTAFLAAFAFPINRRTACLANAQCHLIMAPVEADFLVHAATPTEALVSSVSPASFGLL